MEYIIYCDESSSQGEFFVDFYGGCIVDGKYITTITNELNQKAQELNLTSEIKWTRVTENYLDKYISIITLFFKYIREGKIKIRIMFRKKESARNVISTTDDKYFKLYYQFIKHSFGLRHIPKNSNASIRIYLDKLPDRIEKCERFKDYLYAMQQTKFFEDSGIKILKENIVEIDSKHHIIQQCVDIILGSMYFRLNKLHLAKVPGQSRRGKRTIAKETLYKHIFNEINNILPHFNIGISTGKRNFTNPHWESPYEHWLFTPNQIRNLNTNEILTYT